MILGKYNQAKTILFDLVAPDGVDLIVAATFAAGDIKIMKDEGVEANTTNLPTDEGTGYSLVLTAAEMSAARIRLYIIDQTATKIWLDISLGLETYGHASAEHALDLDTASVAQTGDSYARLGAPAGASVSADLVVIDNFVDELESRLTALRAGYLDNLSVGAVAQASVVTEARLAELDVANLPANVDTLLARIVGTLAAGTHNPATAAQIAVLSDWINAGRLDLILDTINTATAGLAGAAMRGTDNAALASVATEIRLAELDAANLPSDISSLNNISTVQVNAEVDTALADFFTSVAAFVDLIWDEALAGHNTGGSTGKALKQIKEGTVSVESTINDAAATTTSFITALTEVTDNHYRDVSLVFIDGALIGQSRPILSYNGTTKVITLDEALTEAPTDGDTFIVKTDHVHPVSEVQAGLATETKQDIIDTNVDAILIDTGTTLPAQITALNDPTAAAVAAAVAAYDMGSGRTIEEALAFLRNKWTIVAGTLTVYDTDDVTALWTSAMTQTAGDPVSASDPA